MTKLSSFLTRSVKLYLVLLIGSTVAILYGTLAPSDYTVPSSWLGYDKLGHFIMFSTWTFFFGLVRYLKNSYALLPVFITGSVFGLTIEILQHVLPTGRSPESLDFAADLAGILFALLMLYLLSKKVPGFRTDISQ